MVEPTDGSVLPGMDRQRRIEKLSTRQLPRLDNDQAALRVNIVVVDAQAADVALIYALA